jgi:hypothetical protein
VCSQISNSALERKEFKERWRTKTGFVRLKAEKEEGKADGLFKENF